MSGGPVVGSISSAAERDAPCPDHGSAARGARRLGLALAASLALLAVPPAAAQIETVSGAFSLWSSAMETWQPQAFEDFFLGEYIGTGCISAAGPLTISDATGDIAFTVSDGSCPAIDGTSLPGFGVEGSIPQGASLTLVFEHPIHGFYAPYGSLAVGKQVTLHLIGADVDETLLTPASSDATLGEGFGFASERPIDQIVISSNEAGPVLLGHFVGILAGDEEIVYPNGFACTNAPCDFAVAYQIHRPTTFVTPTAGPGELGQWPEAGSATGLAAGDAICAHWAAQIGAVRPERFVAFLGYGTTNPLCRVVGLTGSFSGGTCDGVPFPSRLARWWRVDGLPWGTAPGAGSWNNRRPSLDVQGNRIDAHYFTAWSPAPSFTCGDWTSTSGAANVGDPNSIGASWAWYFDESCALDHPLLCVESALGLPFPAESASGRPIFVTRAHGPGNILLWPEADPLATTGLEAADSICSAEADAAGLAAPSSFRAWLSTPTLDAPDRLTEGPVVRPDGLRVASSLADLVDGKIDTGLSVFADGGDSGPLFSWTGTSPNGVSSGASCGAWDSLVGDGSQGESGYAGGGWTDWWSTPCTGDGHLYCASIAAVPIFADDFELGDTSAWTTTGP